MSDILFFNPGENIDTNNINLNATPIMDNIKLSFPCRAHITLMDSNLFDLGKAGAGGLGFAIKMSNELEISISENDKFEAMGDAPPLLSHITSIMKKIFNYNCGFSINIKTDNFFQSHKGLGSTVAILTTCSKAINMLFGSPLSDEQLRQIIANNYSEVCEGKLAKGMETGVGTALILNGGFVIVSDHLKIVLQKKVFPDYRVVLLDLGLKRFAHKEPENMPEFIRVQLEDQSFRYHKAYLTLLKLIPALHDENFETISEIIWRFQFGGNNLLEFEKYPCGAKEIIEIMNKLRYCSNPRPAVGLSSLGPIVYAFYPNDEKIDNFISKLPLRSYFSEIDNEGIKEI